MPVRTGRDSANLPAPDHGAFQRTRGSKYLQVEGEIVFLFFFPTTSEFVGLRAGEKNVIDCL